jgi:hypothetical protein
VLVLPEVTLIILVVLRLVIRSCRFYIALSKVTNVNTPSLIAIDRLIVFHLRLGEQVLKHPVQVVFALLLSLRFHLLLAHPEVDEDWSAGAEHGRVVQHANRFLRLSHVRVKHVRVLKVSGGMLDHLQRNDAAVLLKLSPAVRLAGIHRNIVHEHV